MKYFLIALICMSILFLTLFGISSGLFFLLRDSSPTVMFSVLLGLPTILCSIPLAISLSSKKSDQTQNIKTFTVKIQDRKTSKNIKEYSDVFQFDLFDKYAFISRRSPENGFIKISIKGKQFEIKNND